MSELEISTPQSVSPQPAIKVTFREYSFFTVSEVATILKVSDDTVTRLFSGRKGVLDIGTPEKLRKRQYRILRISKAALDEFITEYGGVQ